MRQSLFTALAAAIATTVFSIPASAVAVPASASPAASASPSPSSSDATTACSKAISKSIPLTSGFLMVSPAQVAYDCLTSIPYNATKGQAYIKELGKYMQFHSMLNASKFPPASYPIGPIDIMGGLDQISKTDYKSQYLFDRAITELLISSGDSHLGVTGCSMQLFNFDRNVSLVAVSENGLDLPQIYVRRDLDLAAKFGVKISPVVRINKLTATQYIESIAFQSRSHDGHTQWNDMFSSFATLAARRGDNIETVGRGIFATPNNLWPGEDNLLMEFQNGTAINIPLRATVFKTLNKDPKALFNTLCIPVPNPQGPKRFKKRQDKEEEEEEPEEEEEEEEEEEVKQKEQKQKQPTPQQQQQPKVPPAKKSGPSGYPIPFARDIYNEVSGYHLDLDTTVMFLPTFANQEGAPNHGAETSRISQEIVDRAIATGRKRMIIDISGNGGGSIVRGLNLFRLFFPNISPPVTATRFRRHPAATLLSKFGSGVMDGYETRILRFANAFSWKNQTSPDQSKAFPSLEAFMGTEVQFGDEVTSIHANFNFTQTSTVGNPLRGFGPGPAVNSLNKTQPFLAENLLIVGDGVCGSTCTIFVHLMAKFGGVKTVTFGGHPSNVPMHVMGGVRGSQVLEFRDLSLMMDILRQTAKETPKLFTQNDLKTINETFPPPLDKMPLTVPGGRINFKNAYRLENTSFPLQFEFHASDCRLFYTKQNILNPASSWADAKRAIWGGGKCVEGSTGARGSRLYASKFGTGGRVATGGDEKTTPVTTNTPGTPVKSGASGHTVRDTVRTTMALTALVVTLQVFMFM